MKLKILKYTIAFIILSGIVFLGVYLMKRIIENQESQKQIISNHTPAIGQPIDSINGVFVFYNGNVGHIEGRNLTRDGYNLGLKYQCIEFVKRYYFQHLNHKMPDSYGHAKDFFDKTLMDGQYNRIRDLTQYINASRSKPQINDLVVFGATISNGFGHVAIISNVDSENIEIIQQNPGPMGKSRVTFPLEKTNGKWEIKNHNILGWLRKE